VPRGRSWQGIDAAKYPSVLIYAAGCTIDALEDYEKRFEEALIESKSSTDEQRKKRLEEANPSPPIITVITKTFQRNPDIVIEVLRRAKGICEECKKPAPFARRSDRTPDLEVHHIKMLSYGGLDNVENAMALCPNCHRKAHHG
jgi:5-methylcytosine-specific restriction protein A